MISPVFDSLLGTVLLHQHPEFATISVDDSGNVGIGTTNPQGKLHVTGSAGTVLAVIQSAANQTANLTEWQNSSGMVLSAIKAHGDWLIRTGKNSPTAFVVRDGFDVPSFLVDTQNRRLGINTESPLATLHINGGIIRVNQDGVNNYGDTTTYINLVGLSGGTGKNVGINMVDLSAVGASGRIYVQTPSMLVLEVGGYTGSMVTKMTLDTSGTLKVIGVPTQIANLQEWQDSTGKVLSAVSKDGYIGVGTNSPKSTLHVNGGKLVVYSSSGSYGQAQVVNADSRGEASIVFGAGVTGGVGGSLSSVDNNYLWGFGIGMYGNTPDKFSFGSVAGSQMFTVVSPSGYVGIGTASPAGKLHVKGKTDDEQLIVQANSTQTANLTEWQNSSGTVLASINKDGGFSAKAISSAGTLGASGNSTLLGAVGIGGANDGATYKLMIYTPDGKTGMRVLVNPNNSDATTTGFSFDGVPTATAGTYRPTVVGAEALFQPMAYNTAVLAVAASYGFRVLAPKYVGPAGYVPTAAAVYGFYAHNQGNAQSTNSYALYIESQSGSTSANYAIYTNQGKVRFGDDVLVTGGIDAAVYKTGGVAGVSGTFTTTDGKTITVTNGIVTSIL